MGLRLGLDLGAVRPGCAAVVESPLRLRKQMSYGFVHALWLLRLEDGRVAVTVPPGASDAVRRALPDLHEASDVFAPGLPERLRNPIDQALVGAGLGKTDRVLHDLCFACNPDLLRAHRCGDCRRLTDESTPPAEGLSLPSHCFPDGIAYGVVADDRVVSCAFAHRTGTMEDRVADIGVTTAPPYRRRGFAKTAVSAVAAHVAKDRGEARYACSPTNLASAATARSVGFATYGTSLILSAPAPDLA